MSAPLIVAVVIAYAFIGSLVGMVLTFQGPPSKADRDNSRLIVGAFLIAAIWPSLIIAAVVTAALWLVAWKPAELALGAIKKRAAS